VNQNVNHVDHVIWVCRPENQLAYVQNLAVLTTREFQGPFYRTDMAICVYLSWGGGLEIIAPLDEDNPVANHMREHIEKNGEGLFGVVFGVPDIEAAMSRAAEIGYREQSEILVNTGQEQWHKILHEMKEVRVGDFMNSLFIFGQIEYEDGIFTTRKSDSVS
jgi:hypothetical protein